MTAYAIFDFTNYVYQILCIPILWISGVEDVLISLSGGAGGKRFLSNIID